MTGRRAWTLLTALVALGVVLLLATTLSAAPGDLDPTFDADGKVTTDFGGADYLGAVAMQRDGKIVAAGGMYSPGVDDNFVLARYNPDGSLDSAFGSGGKVRTDFGPGWDAWAEALAIQRDGKIVVAGNAWRYETQDDDFALARYNADGSLDSTFGGDGRVVSSLQKSDYGNDLAIQADGKIVVVGQTAALPPADRDFALARFNADGSLDTSFGGAGFVITPTFDVATSVLIQPDGKIVAAGFASDMSPPSLGLARYNAEGSLDASFAGDGMVEMPNATGARSVALQPDGKIVVAAGLVARYNADGSLDTGFGSNGTWSGPALATVVLVQPGRKLIVAGNSWSARPDSDFFAVRLGSDGWPDDIFGGQNGDVRTDLGSNSYDTVSAAVLQADNRIVVAGSTWPSSERRLERDFALVRYLSEPPCRVPNVRGKKFAAAKSAITKAHCSLGKVKRKTSKRMKRGRVISQNPKAGTQLSNLGKVNLVVSKGRGR